MNAKAWVLLGVWAAGAAPSLSIPDVAPDAPIGLQSNVVFTRYSPLSSASEIIRRMMTPLDASRVAEASSRTGKSLQGQAIDLSKERFAVYVPRTAPPSGYSVLAFVSPYEDGGVPLDWTSALDRHGTIFVTAAHSGNSTNVFDRREPLALLGAINVLSRYAVDPRRIYVAGFSGGSRVAERLAIGYPELFRGVLLYAGSDPLGDARLPLPPAEIFARFQESSRVVYATGTRDAYHMTEDVQSRESMQAWCVFDVATVSLPWTGHELPDGATFERLLDALNTRTPLDDVKLAECRAHVAASLDSALREVEALVQAGKMDKARRALDHIDTRFGGLAGARITELAAVLRSAH